MSNRSEFEIKKGKALERLRATGMRQSVYKPIVLRLLWRLGLKVPPPHFVGFWGLALVSGAYFGAALTLAGWLVDYIRRGRIYLFPMVFTGIAAAIYGIGMSMYYDAGRRKNQLPSWSSLGSSGNLSADEEGLFNRLTENQTRGSAANGHFNEDELAKDISDAIRDVRKQKK